MIQFVVEELERHVGVVEGADIGIVLDEPLVSSNDILDYFSLYLHRYVLVPRNNSSQTNISTSLFDCGYRRFRKIQAGSRLASHVGAVQVEYIIFILFSEIDFHI